MTRRLHTSWLIGLAVSTAGFGMASAVAQVAGAALGVLDRIEPGRWELHSRTPGEPPETVCLPNGRRLIQLRHPGIACDSYVVEDLPDQVVVQYTCPRRGYGRTHIRRENARLVQIETQGIAQGAPFDVVAEGRRVGSCAITLP